MNRELACAVDCEVYCHLARGVHSCVGFDVNNGFERNLECVVNRGTNPGVGFRLARGVNWRV